jgi:Inner membrane component of T3SS, cytoplasmic domain
MWEGTASEMTRCPEGHFYDPARHTACPWCALPADTGLSEQKTRRIRTNAQATVPMRPPAPRVPPPLPGSVRVDPAAPPPPLPAPSPAPRGPGSTPPNATVRVGAVAKSGLKDGPVVGWLVCLEGPDRGRDYRLRMEKNFIGRAPHMDVVIENDSTVSRDKHAIVIFDPKKKVFWVLPGEASGLVYLNGDLVNSPAQMKPDDILEVGQTKLVLIPFCGDRYSWSQDAAAPPAEV